MDMLEIKKLQKRFGDKEVLKGLDLSVPEHSVFGFIGKNGAGKTTTMKTVLGLLKADAGEIWVAGEPVMYGQTTTNRYIGYLPDVPEFYSFMTPMEYLAFCGEITGMDKKEIKKRSGELLELVGLGGEKHRIKGFSRGMKQRLGIAQALLNRPKLLICDEPTSALDPVGRKEILDILLAVKEQTTVVFSTHILSDVERICTDVAFLHEGKVHLQGKLSDIKSKYRTDEYLLETETEADLNELIGVLRTPAVNLYYIKGTALEEKVLKHGTAFDESSDIEGITDAVRGTAGIFKGIKRTGKNQLMFREDEISLFDVLRVVTEKNIPLLKVERLEPTLESLFLEVVKR